MGNSTAFPSPIALNSVWIWKIIEVGILLILSWTSSFYRLYCNQAWKKRILGICATITPMFWSNSYDQTNILKTVEPFTAAVFSGFKCCSSQLLDNISHSSKFTNFFSWFFITCISLFITMRGRIFSFKGACHYLDIYTLKTEKINDESWNKHVMTTRMHTELQKQKNKHYINRLGHQT